ncbi:Smr/MutS family protein [Weeksellaceae bacterium A-14]
MKIGDSVAVIDEDLKGTVTSIHGNQIDFKDENGFVYQYPAEKLVSHSPSLYENMRVESKPEYVPPKSKKHAANQLVLDLHFDQLVENPQDFESFERLFLQKEKLMDTLEFCRRNRIKKLEIIHGIGDGTLQQLVTDTLKSQTGLDFYNKEILHHQSGAVMVEFH